MRIYQSVCGSFITEIDEMRIRFSMLNPFYKKDVHGKDYFYQHWTISANKSAEIQISKFSRCYIFDCKIDLHWWGEDHAGPEIDLNIWGYMFNAKIYDRRHWDYENHRWEEHRVD